mgnify:CR=1 FL=1
MREGTSERKKAGANRGRELHPPRRRLVILGSAALAKHAWSMCPGNRVCLCRASRVRRSDARPVGREPQPERLRHFHLQVAAGFVASHNEMNISNARGGRRDLNLNFLRPLGLMSQRPADEKDAPYPRTDFGHVAHVVR